MFGSRAPVAQLDRASDFESAGRPFESGRARQIKIAISKKPWLKQYVPQILIVTSICRTGLSRFLTVLTVVEPCQSNKLAGLGTVFVTPV